MPTYPIRRRHRTQIEPTRWQAENEKLEKRRQRETNGQLVPNKIPIRVTEAKFKCFLSPPESARNGEIRPAVSKPVPALALRAGALPSTVDSLVFCWR